MVTPLVIASSRRGEGKTTLALGLLSAFGRRGRKAGFIKPIGRATVDFAGQGIDGDVILVKEACNVPSYLKDMGPVATSGEFPVNFLTKEGHRTVLDRVTQAFERVAAGKDLVIVESAGGAAAGAAFGVSSAELARRFGAKVLFVASGGIGQPIDAIHLNKSYFQVYGVEVIGVILNKVFPKEMESVQSVVRRACEMLDVPLLGAIPHEPDLSRPTMQDVHDELKGEILNGEAELANHSVGKLLLGAMTAHNALEYLEGQILLVVPGDRDDLVLAALSTMYLGERSNYTLSGVVLTDRIAPSRRLRQIVGRTTIPVIAVEHDSYTAASRINELTAKLTPRDAARIDRAKAHIRQHVDAAAILTSLGLGAR